MAASISLDSADAYPVAWIAALPHERAAATASLDEEHLPPANFTKNAADNNAYTWGRIGLHNVVIASLPAGRYGTSAAAITAHALSSSLPHVHIGLLVGIGAGIPGEVRSRRTGKLQVKRDIRLGDIVVGEPNGSNGGVVQHDFFKAKTAGGTAFRESLGSLNSPPDVLLNALGALRSRHEMTDSEVPKILAESLDRFPKMKGYYDYPATCKHDADMGDDDLDSEMDVVEDRLFQSTHAHVAGADCRDCDSAEQIKRKARPSTSPKVHYGTIASGNQLVKDGREREALIQQLKEDKVDAICIEMEAAGLVNTFPCLVIRGVCDYADSHKNDAWQRYAALTAASFAKEFLGYVDAKTVETTPRIGKVLTDKHQRQALLDKLSVRDYARPLRKARNVRHGETCKWFLSTEQLRDWKAEPESAVLWLSGKLGSGKTVIVGTVIDSLFAIYPTSSVRIAYFFCRFNDDDSLRATTILRSIVRQCIAIEALSMELKTLLERTVSDPFLEADDLGPLLQLAVTASSFQFIIIDGTDDCSERERSDLFAVLGKTMADSSNIKLFLASRNKIDRQIQRASGTVYSATVKHVEMNADIAGFVKDALAERVSDGSLLVGSGSLLNEVYDALIAGAQGMFLWVDLQIKELCNQICDEDIRKAICNLPRDLSEAYMRSLARIERTDKCDLASRIFRWVAVAKTPLTLSGLHEALAVEPGDRYLNRERMVHGLYLLDDWSGGLLAIDDEDVVEYAHPTVLELILGQIKHPDFAFDREDADKQAGIICVTYLNFSDFETQLARGHKARDPTAQDILQAWKPKGRVTKIFEVMQLRRGRSSGPSGANLDISQQLSRLALRSSTSTTPSLHGRHPFLSYASEHWLMHATRFREEDSIWPLWERLLEQRSSHVFSPPELEDLSYPNCLTATWVARHDHAALLAGSKICTPGFQGPELQIMLDSAARSRSFRIVQLLCSDSFSTGLHFEHSFLVASGRGDVEMVKRLLARIENIDTMAPNHRYTALQAAASGGHLELVERLLAAKADVNARPAELEWRQTALQGTVKARTALQAAAGNGHLEVVTRLLAAKAIVNAAPAERYGRTALQAAAEGGHLQVVNRLLALGAKVDAPPAFKGGRTALQAAAQGGHLRVVERLLPTRASVNERPADYSGLTALQSAALGGHLEVVERLLAAGADVNAAPVEHSGRTALQAAAEGGCLEVVERLLADHANVNAAPAEHYGRTALQAAAEGGYLEIIKTLLTAKADVNARAAKYGQGWTALQAAAAGGHLGIVETLLIAKADVNAKPTEYGQGGTALQTAAASGHLEVVERLLAAHADADGWADEHTALQAAAEGGHLEIVERLLAAHADVNASRGYPMATALHRAAGGGHLEVVERLLAAKAEVRIRGDASRTVLHVAAAGGHLEVVERLLAAKAKVNARDRYEQTALQSAAAGGHLEIVERLRAAETGKGAR